MSINENKDLSNTVCSSIYSEWTKDRELHNLSTNSGAPELPFQNWRHFKEAFAPELVAYVIERSKVPVKTCLDPFAGSGTTPLACQFLHVYPIAIEVNPFLADLIEAKVARHDISKIIESVGSVMRSVSRARVKPENAFKNAPPTFVEPGVRGRFIFHRQAAARLAAFRFAIDRIDHVPTRCLFRALLGSVAGKVSNAVVSGKGRRYRSGWQDRTDDPYRVDKYFADTVADAVGDIRTFADRPERGYTLIRGDARESIRQVGDIDLAVFSPPYPNSFDYTDVYNIELWTLGYLDGAKSNRNLRQATISSHVQLLRDFLPPPAASKTLEQTVRKLKKKRSQLWNRSIPEMVGAYFADMQTVIQNILCVAIRVRFQSLNVNSST